MTDPVREALEAAGRAVREASLCGARLPLPGSMAHVFCADAPPEVRTNCDCAQIGGAAVLAFLKTLRDDAALHAYPTQTEEYLTSIISKIESGER